MKKLWILIILISATVALLNSANFFFGLIQQAPGTIYLGTTFYFEDYFFYLNHFFQGAHGAWLVANRYTGEPTSPSINYWSNLLMGKIGGFFGLSPILSYNLWVIILSFAVLLLSYQVIRLFLPQNILLGFTAYIFSTFAAPLMNRIFINGQPLWYPFELWRTPHFIFNRLGNAPHQLTQTIIFYLLTLASLARPDSTKNQKISWFVSFLLMLMLTSLNPVMASVFVLTAWVANLVSLGYQHKPLIAWKKLFLISLSFIFTFGYMWQLMNTLPHLQSKIWEASQQLITTLPFFLKSMGPISLLAALGGVVFLLHPEPRLIFSVVLIAVSYGLLISPLSRLLGISNLRLFFPALYPFLGVLAIHGTLTLATFCHKKPLSFHPKATIFLILSVFLLFSFPTLWWEIGQKLQTNTDPATIRLQYLSKEIYRAFVFLKNTPPYEDIVLASPYSRMDLLVPALTGHTSYSGHPLTTIDADGKNQIGVTFYNLWLSPQKARQWLQGSRIRYVIFTQYDGDVAAFHQTYPFLKLIFSERGATVFRVR